MPRRAPRGGLGAAGAFLKVSYPNLHSFLENPPGGLTHAASKNGQMLTDWPGSHAAHAVFILLTF